jgi:outer membrane receptor for ferrienterochelin and colicins
MMRKILIYQVLFLFSLGLKCINLNASGTEKIVSQLHGYITDSETGYALPYATIGIAGTTIGTTSCHHGKFYLEGELTMDAVMVISYTGYDRREVPLNELDVSGNLHIELSRSFFNLDEVVVTGTRTYKTLKEVPVITRVISARDIQQNDVVNFRELLELELPGLEFTRMGGMSAINMQGMGGNYILFLIDGERMTGEIRNNVDYNRINMENIERIEVVKGAASTLYGSSAVGGVVNIITKTANRPLQINLHSRMGGMGENHHGVNIGGKYKKWTSHTAASYRQTQSYELQNSSYLVRNLEDGNTLTDDILRRTHVDGSLNRTLDQRLQFRPQPGMLAEVKLGFFDNERFNAGMEGDRRRDFYQDYNGTARFSWDINPMNRIEASYHYDNYSKYDYFVRLGTRESNYTSILHNPRVIHNARLGQRHELTTGLEYLSESLTTFMFTDDLYRTTSSYVAFVQDDFKLGKSFNIISGLRYDHHSAFGGHLSPKLSAMYKAGSMTYRGGYAAGYRSPNTRELYTDWDHRGMFRLVGNANLIPETSHNFNLSSEYWHKRVNASVVGYYNQINNKIQQVWNLQQDTAFHRNIDQARVWGADLNLTWRLADNLSLRTAYAYVNDISEEEGRNLSATRPHSLVVRGEYRFRFRSISNSLSLGMRALSGITIYSYHNPSEQYISIDYPGYQIWRASISTRLPYGLNATATVDNIFGYKASVVTFNSSISPGRLFYFGLSWDIDRLINYIF